MELIKSIWPEWEIVRQLGRGSFGTVYEAVRKDHNLESKAAIKVITIPQSESEIDSLKSEGMTLNATRTYLQNVVEDFVGEIRLMESFKGIQNIVSVEDYKVVEKTDEIGWDIYIRMELLTPLTSYAADQILTEKDIIKLGCDICTALELCSRRDIIHRDIKPENIFVNSFGDFKLGDFGIARKLENTTGGLSQKGTYNYMAPEVRQGIRYDASVDQYSLGLVLYRFANKSRLPFLDTDKQLLSPNDRMEAINRRMSGEKLPAPCDASAELADVILRACSFDPGARFSSATEMKKALISVSEGTYSIEKARPQSKRDKVGNTEETVSVRNTAAEKDTGSVNTFTKKKKSKKPLFVAVVLILLIACGAGAYYRFWLWPDGKDQKKSAAEEYNEADESARAIPEDTEESSVESEEKQISEIIDNAEKLSGSGDYAGAVSVIEEGLVNFPVSNSLKQKKEEYEQMLAKQEKESILKEADDLAQKGDYESAISVIAKAWEKDTDDPDYKKTYQLYVSAYIKNVIDEADALADNGKYAEAVKKVENATLVTGEDTTLRDKEKEYEDKYVLNVISDVDNFITSEEYDNAEDTLNEAIQLFPGNEALNEKRMALSNIGPNYLLNVCSPYQTDAWMKKDTYSISGVKYTEGFNFFNGSGYAYFNLKGQYDMLIFDIGHIDDKSMYEGTYNFYLDHDLVSTLSIDPESLIQHVEIPLKDANQLLIKASDCGYAYAFVNVKIRGNGKTNYTETKSNDDQNIKSLLTVCPPYQSFGYTTKDTYSLAGDKYANGFTFFNGSGDVYFNLKGKYSTLEFDVGHIDGAQMSEGTYSFYLDEELIKTLAFKPDMLVEHISIPLNYANQLYIKASDCGYAYAFVNVTVNENSTIQTTSNDTTISEGQNLLSVCPPYQSFGYTTKDTYSLAGDRYANGFNFFNGSGDVYFNLKGKYSTLEFDVGHIDGAQMSEGTYSFYLDEKLEKTMTFKPNMLVEHVKIPLKGADQLYIKASDCGYAYAFVNVQIY